MKTRVPSDLVWIILWTLLLGALSTFVAITSPRFSTRVVYGGFGVVYLMTALGLYRMRPWGRTLGGTVLLLGAVLHAASLYKGFEWGRLFRIGMNLYWGVYLFLPATRRLFAGSAGARFNRIEFLVLVSSLLVFTVTVVAVVALGLPTSIDLLVISLVVISYTLLEERLTARLTLWFAPRPDDLKREDWAAFRSAREAWLRKDFDAAESLLRPLPPTLYVRLLLGILRMDRARACFGLDRILYDYTVIAPPGDRAAVLAECRAPDLDARIAARAAVVDDLIEDDARAYPLFASEFGPRISAITGEWFITNPSFQHREDWEKRRPLCTGDRMRVWLTIRLWDAQCLEAAEEVAASSKDVQLAELASLAARLNLKESQGITEEWLLANSSNFCLLPGFSDASRLLFLDSPYLESIGAQSIAARMPARLEYVARLRRLREEYPAESHIEIPWLMGLLAGDVGEVPRGKKAFDSWWARRRAAQSEFDGAFVVGLDAARRGDWTRAEQAFGEAERAWAERSCAGFNHALALLHLGRFREAEALLVALAGKEPEEAVYWMRIGDARRAQGHSKAALEAYRTAARLGGFEEQIALRMGTTLAEEGRDDEAERQLDSFAGPDAGPQKIEDLAAFLESQGIYRLAARFRERALYQRLGEKPMDKGDDPEGDEDLE